MTLKDYEIISELGNGGMGVVYLARDPKLDRLVAIKQIKVGAESGQEIIEQSKQRFYREGRAIANLNHTNIVKIFALSEDSLDNSCYMVMEYIQGKSLEQLTEKDVLTVEKVRQIGIQACEALAYIHQKNIIHRDIKPANMILSDDGLLKLMDFGIARVNDNLNLTTAGSLVGSVLYMAPEQIINPSDTDPHADIYALGVTLYKLLSGYFPFNSNNACEAIAKIISGNAFPLTRANPQIPQDFADIIMKAIATKKKTVIKVWLTLWML